MTDDGNGVCVVTVGDGRGVVVVPDGVRRRAGGGHPFGLLLASRRVVRGDGGGCSVHVVLPAPEGLPVSVAEFDVSDAVNRLVAVAIGGQGFRGLADMDCREVHHVLEAAALRMHTELASYLRMMADDLVLPEGTFSAAITAVTFLSGAAREYPFGFVAVLDAD